jgi:hypothetical protein
MRGKEEEEEEEEGGIGEGGGDRSIDGFPGTEEWERERREKQEGRKWWITLTEEETRKCLFGRTTKSILSGNFLFEFGTKNGSKCEKNCSCRRHQCFRSHRRRWRNRR